MAELPNVDDTLAVHVDKCEERIPTVLGFETISDDELKEMNSTISSTVKMINGFDDWTRSKHVRCWCRAMLPHGDTNKSLRDRRIEMLNLAQLESLCVAFGLRLRDARKAASKKNLVQRLSTFLTKTQQEIHAWHQEAQPETEPEPAPDQQREHDNRSPSGVQVCTATALELHCDCTVTAL